MDYNIKKQHKIFEKEEIKFVKDKQKDGYNISIIIDKMLPYFRKNKLKSIQNIEDTNLKMFMLKAFYFTDWVKGETIIPETKTEDFISCKILTEKILNKFGMKQIFINKIIKKIDNSMIDDYKYYKIGRSLIDHYISLKNIYIEDVILLPYYKLKNIYRDDIKKLILYFKESEIKFYIFIGILDSILNEIKIGLGPGIIYETLDKINIKYL